MSMWCHCNLIHTETGIYQYNIFPQIVDNRGWGPLMIPRYAEVARNKVGVHGNYQSYQNDRKSMSQKT